MVGAKPRIEQTQPPRSPRETLPTMYDLPTGNAGENPEESGLPDEFHDCQGDLLSETFRLTDYVAGEAYTASDLNLYYDINHPLWYKRPDWFAVLGVPRLFEGDMRLSYVLWQEGVSPFVVVELLSPGTEKEDLGETERVPGQPPTKWEVYEQVLRVPYYVVFDRYVNRLRVFVLQAGRYQERLLEQEASLGQPKIWMPELMLGLGMWEGEYQGITRRWLRWYGEDGEWVKTEAERASQAQGKLDSLLAKLKAAEIDPEKL